MHNPTLIFSYHGFFVLRYTLTFNRRTRFFVVITSFKAFYFMDYVQQDHTEHVEYDTAVLDFGAV
jgi:hypothetical protein